MKFLVLIPFKENMTQSIHFYLLPKILSKVFGKLSPHWRNFVVMSTPNQDRQCFNSRQNNFFCKLPPLWQCLFTETVKCYNIPFLLFCSSNIYLLYKIKLFCIFKVIIIIAVYKNSYFLKRIIFTQK
jgi:hypothetical protein